MGVRWGPGPCQGQGKPGRNWEGKGMSIPSLPPGASPALAAAGGVGEPMGIPRSWIIYGQRQQLTGTLFAICL